MKPKLLVSLIISISMFFVFGLVAIAQSYTPNVQVAGTGVVDGVVTIVEATVDGPGWVVIHADADGKPGPVIGYAPLVEGMNTSVPVEVDPEGITPIMHAMLHVDEGEVGVYEFPGADGPVKIGDAIVMARFSAEPVMAAEEEMTAPDAMPDTGAATSSPMIAAVLLAALGALGVGVVLSRRSQVSG